MSDMRESLGGDAVESARRIRGLEERLEGLGMGFSGVELGCPPGVHEAFLESVLSFETAPVGRRFDWLVKRGIELPEPRGLDHAALTVKLWEVIRALAAADVYLDHTDHLSDRELYDELWTDLLRQEIPMFPPGSGWRDVIDLVGGGTDEEIELALRYYDDEPTRRHWAKAFPEFRIPEPEEPPFDRDRFLPRPPEEAGPEAG